MENQKENLNQNLNQNQISVIQEFIQIHLDPFIAISQEIGGEIAILCDFFKFGIESIIDLLEYAKKYQEPFSKNILEKVYQPISDVIMNVSNYKNSHRSSDYFDMVLALADATSIMGFVPFRSNIKEYAHNYLESSMYHANKIIRESKTSDPLAYKWGSAFITMAKELAALIGQHFDNGIQWNTLKDEEDFDFEYEKDIEDEKEDQESKREFHIANLFHMHESFQSSFREKSKNSIFELANEQFGTVTSSVTHKPKSEKEPVFKRIRKEWLVENFVNRSDGIILDDVNHKQNVCVFNCKNTVVLVQGMVSSVVVDHCEQCAVIFEKTLTGASVLNSYNIELRVKQKTPSITIENSNHIKTYLSDSTLTTEIISATSTELFLIVNEALEDDPDVIVEKEYRLPEVYKSFLNEDTLELETETVQLI
ncbi:adenylyl cyclase-associated protein [Anaeramoeba ignava]|uniref:Adenylyl cyclase-associated protein n=1 Tax=Anaeramoeba ignava TaxID=1746090 RepID=A0A9Q0R808_ANAIG|nr:adenylyl cyclase-associated protein [Anaeramoeba ignava]